MIFDKPQPKLKAKPSRAQPSPAQLSFDGFHIVVKQLRWGTKQPWSGSRKYYPLCPHLNLSNIFNLYFILHYWFSCHFSCPVVQLFCSYVEYYFQLCNIYCRPVKLKKNILSIYFSLYMNLMNTLSEYIHTQYIHFSVS